MSIYNHPISKNRRRDLRKDSSDAERLLWGRLRNKQLSDLKFLRQYSVGPYILDFYCPTRRLAIELDGGQHNEPDQEEYDTKRTLFLEQQDIRVLRFWNNEVLKNIEEVLEMIMKEIQTLPNPPLP